MSARESPRWILNEEEWGRPKKERDKESSTGEEEKREDKWIENCFIDFDFFPSFSFASFSSFILFFSWISTSPLPPPTRSFPLFFFANSRQCWSWVSTSFSPSHHQHRRFRQDCECSQLSLSTLEHLWSSLNSNAMLWERRIAPCSVCCCFCCCSMSIDSTAALMGGEKNTAEWHAHCGDVKLVKFVASIVDIVRMSRWNMTVNCFFFCYRGEENGKTFCCFFCFLRDTLERVR